MPTAHLYDLYAEHLKSGQQPVHPPGRNRGVPRQATRPRPARRCSSQRMMGRATPWRITGDRRPPGHRRASCRRVKITVWARLRRVADGMAQAPHWTVIFSGKTRTYREEPGGPAEKPQLTTAVSVPVYWIFFYVIQ